MAGSAEGVGVLRFSLAMSGIGGDEGVCGIAVGSLAVALDDGRDDVPVGVVSGAEGLGSSSAGAADKGSGHEVVLGSDSAAAASGVSLEGVGDEVSGLGFVVVGTASALVESLDSASFSEEGSSRPRFSARRKIPAAALGLKKNLSGTDSSSTSANDEDASPPLGHSEVSAVQHSPGEVVKPDVAQRADHDGEISSTLGTEQAGDVLNNDPSACANKLICDSGELEEQAGSLPGEPCSPSGDGEVLARESSAEQINAGVRISEWNSCPFSVGASAVSDHFSGSASFTLRCDFSNVFEARDSRPVLGEDSPAPGIPLALEGDSHPGLFEPEVDASDA